MNRRAIFLAAAVLLLQVMAFSALAEAPRRIALTFDDAPRSAGAYADVETRTNGLIDSLASRKVEGAMFFATTRNLDARGEEGIARLERYAAAGHVIANHSHAHGSANDMSADEFLADVARAKDKLADFPNNTPYFRFPFLNEGDTPEKRDAIREGLEHLGLKQGYVTVDNYDWYLQALFDESIRAGQTPVLDEWRAVYVEVLMGAVQHYDAMAIETLGHSPAHVLLLHENDLAALFIGDLADALRDAGWEVIPAIEAYEDPIALDTPDTMLLGQGRIGAFAAIAGTPGRELRHPLESEAELRAMLEGRGMMGSSSEAQEE